MLQSEGWPTAVEVDLWLCSDEEIRKLNATYRGQDRPTDVLSFPQLQPGERPAPGLPAALGDIVISIDTARRQADARNASLGAEITGLFLHSLLHLIGYDDDTEVGLQRMIDKAAAILPAPSGRQSRTAG